MPPIILRFCLLICFSAALLLPTLPDSQAQAPLDTRFAITDVMIPMRDGAKLNTKVYVPRDITGTLPILLLRTPYGIGTRAERDLRGYLRDLADDGYIFAFQDIRGRFKSEGKFVMTHPGRDKKDPKATDEASDTHDTIDWLLANAKGNNGRVGMLGISYGGWLTAVAMIEPHPALKAASPQASPIDMYLGDDFHHNGAFRLSYGFEYVAMMETDKENTNFQFNRRDTFEWYMKLGALSNINTKYFKGTKPTWNDFVAHPNYDAYWKEQSLEPRLTRITVPALNVAGWFDQEDFRGPLRIYELLEKHDKKNQNFLVVGPWNHGGWSSGPADRLGKITFDSATGKYFRSKVQAPFFAHYLKDVRQAEQPEALMFQTGANKWASHDSWPPKNATPRKWYFQPGGKLTTTPPKEGDRAFDTYQSDPANPVPYRPRPVTATYPGKEWQEWMVEDQRFTQYRPDVLTYESEPLTEDVVVAGSMTVRLFGSTSGTDCDWIVRLIDAYPEDYAGEAEMSGYQLLISGEPVRARFRHSLEKPEAVVPDQVEEYLIDLHWGHHCFRKGHKIMVQVSSTWFPLIDRNPQQYVPNIFEAKDEDFRPARQRVHRSGKHPSHVVLETMPGS